MEVKKTHSANLENKRVTNYLLGLVVVLSFLFVALEYNSNSRTFDFDDEVPDDFFEEMEQPVPEPIANDDKPRIVQQMPEYPGGIVEFMKWLQRTLRYPPTAQQQGIQGSVMVSFIVNADGTITDQKVVRGVNEDLDAEALRVISHMPKWKPGLDKGKPCRTLFAIPIVFKL